MGIKYRVGIENEIEHIDYWDYEENELELAKAKYDSIQLNNGEIKYLFDLETEKTIEELAKSETETLSDQRQREKEFADKLEKLVGRRFETIMEMEKVLTEYLETKNPISLDFAYQNWEIDHTCDWNLIGECETELVYCDIDIYFLWDRENRLYITEVGYEFN